MRTAIALLCLLAAMAFAGCRSPRVTAPVAPPADPSPDSVRTDELFDKAMDALFDAQRGQGSIELETMPATQERTGPATTGREPERLGYPDERLVGTPTDVSRDLATAFPKEDSIVGATIIPKPWFEFKRTLYERTGIKLALSYQGIAGKGSSALAGEDQFIAGWLLLEGKWEAYCRGGDYEGGIVFAYDYRHTIGDSQIPAAFGTAALGSLWPTEFAYPTWDPWFSTLFLEQWIGKNEFVVRVGNQLASSVIDFFRFKDPRVAFSGAPLTAPAHAMPFPGPGGGLSFQWWPNQGDAYVTGTVNDLNFTIGEIDWSTALDHGQFFYGLEIGTFWRRSPTDFDHLHATLFYADERDDTPAVLPNKSGGGVKVAGEKQCGRWVGFGSYAYNTAEGGGFGITFCDHAATAGVAFLKPFGVLGEIAVAGSWARPIQDLGGAPTLTGLDDQWGVETYWKILLTPDMWVTPGAQFIWNPSLNPTSDFESVAQIKFRLFL